MAARRTIPVQIQGQEYRVRGESDADVAAVRRAASLVDETMARVREKTRTVDSLDAAILAALNLANRLIGQTGNASSHAAPADARRLAHLIDEVESALAPGTGSDL